MRTLTEIGEPASCKEGLVERVEFAGAPLDRIGGEVIGSDFERWTCEIRAEEAADGEFESIEIAARVYAPENGAVIGERGGKFADLPFEGKRMAEFLGGMFKHLEGDQSGVFAGGDFTCAAVFKV